MSDADLVFNRIDLLRDDNLIVEELHKLMYDIYTLVAVDSSNVLNERESNGKNQSIPNTNKTKTNSNK